MVGAARGATAGAPNVLLIITDDAGFGVPSTFGGVIPTPTMDRIANEGLRYNRIFSARTFFELRCLMRAETDIFFTGKDPYDCERRVTPRPPGAGLFVDSMDELRADVIRHDMEQPRSRWVQ